MTHNSPRSNMLLSHVVITEIVYRFSPSSIRKLKMMKNMIESRTFAISNAQWMMMILSSFASNQNQNDENFVSGDDCFVSFFWWIIVLDENFCCQELRKIQKLLVLDHTYICSSFSICSNHKMNVIGKFQSFLKASFIQSWKEWKSKKIIFHQNNSLC